MFKIEYKDLAWWYWLVTAPLLTYGLMGNPEGFLLAIGLNVIQLVQYIIRNKGLTAFPVQVRYWYLALLIIAWAEPLQWLYWIPTIGTWAQVLFGYCAMARTVSLLPWNRTEPFTLAFLKKTFFSPPVRGNVLQGFAPGS